MNKLVRSFIRALALGGVLILVGCGGGGGDSSTGAKPFGDAGATSGSAGAGGATTGTAPVVPPVPVAGQASLVLTLADPTTGATTNTVPAIARAIVRDANSLPVANAVVTFVVAGQGLADVVPTSGTALTDATGTATVRITAASLTAQGATTLTASAQAGTTAVSGSIGFAIGSPNVTLTNFTFGTNPLSAFGTTSVSVTVNSSGTPISTPQTVSFSSSCAVSAKAVLSASVLTSNGIATASYRDNGCAGNDLITASVGGLASESRTLTIAIPSAGSIQFVSADPATITLKGTGGAGRQEASLVKFKVVDTGGNPLSTAQTVNFELSTSVGGITFANGLTTTTAVSDAVTGEAAVTVNAGVVATPVRVRATTTGAGGVTLASQSDQLTITTGIPDDARMSIAATTLNIEGADIDGTTTVVTARLGDHFGNPVPNGTAVNFVAEAGLVTNSAGIATGSCTTTDSQCQVNLRSQGDRPFNGRVTVLSYVLGEETFVDLDGDGLADNGAERVKIDGTSSDLSEAFLDSNENGTREATSETFIDLDRSGTYSSGDGKYNGVLCNELTGSAAGTCSSQKSVHIFRNIPIVFSGSHAVLNFFETTTGALVPLPVGSAITFGRCTDNVLFAPESRTLLVTVTDDNGNVMPAGSRVEFTISNGRIISDPKTFTIPNSIACRADGGVNCPAGSAVPLTVAPDNLLSFEVAIRSAVTQDNNLDCLDPATSPGKINITVTTPSGVVSNQGRQTNN